MMTSVKAAVCLFIAMAQPAMAQVAPNATTTMGMRETMATTVATSTTVPGTAVLSGTTTLSGFSTVASATSFASDPVAQGAVAKGICSSVGLDQSYCTASGTVKSSRRMSYVMFRGLQTAVSVIESYNITVPPTGAPVTVAAVQTALTSSTIAQTLTTSIKAALAAVPGAPYAALNLTASAPTVTVVGGATTTMGAARTSGAYYVKGCLATISLLIAAALS